MKKLTTILLLLLLLFNLFGYHFWFDYVQREANKQLEALLDKEDYNEQDLITIKIPLSLPYQYDRKDFERVNGEITLDGNIYKYVKRKVVNGELILLCLPNHNKMQLESARDDFFKLANDFEQNHSSKSSGSKSTAIYKGVVSDYDDHSQQGFTLSFPQQEKLFYVYYIDLLPSAMPHSPEQPPELIIL